MIKFSTVLFLDLDNEYFQPLQQPSLASQTLTHYMGRESGQTRTAEL